MSGVLPVSAWIAPGADLTADPETWPWVEITGRVRIQDNIAITYGLRDEGSKADPSTCRLTINNRNGDFSPANPLGQWYGLLGRNTPIRVDWDTSSRFSGFFSELPTRWDRSGADSWVPATASGILRRLQQGDAPLLSALRRFIPTTAPVAYWSLTEGEDAKEAAPVVGKSPLRPRGIQPRWAEHRSVPWLETFPEWTSNATDARLYGAVSMPGFADEWGVGALFMPDEWEAGVSGRPAFIVRGIGDNDGILYLSLWASDEDMLEINWTLIEESASSTAPMGEWVAPGLHDGNPHWVEMRAWQDGSTLRATVYMDGVELVPDFGGSEPFTLQEPVQIGVWGRPGDSIGHVAVWDNHEAMEGVAAAALGFAGERAGERFGRLCAEQGIPVEIIGDPADSEPMGPQTMAGFLTLLGEAAELDGGIMCELGFGLGYIVRSELYSQVPALEVEPADDMPLPPEPVDDDQGLRNDVTVKRSNGSEVRVVDEASVATLGRYDETIELNTVIDGRLANLASWRLHLGTTREMRWPMIPLRLHDDHPLVADWLAFRIGNRVRVANRWAQIAGVEIDVLVQGWTETLNEFESVIQLNCSPAGPWDVAAYESGAGGTFRYDTAGSSLAEEFDAGSDTSMSVNVDAGPLWTTDSAEFPFDIECGGVRLEVTGISGESSPQTFTITQTAVNGIEKLIPAGTPVSLWTKARYAL